MRLVLAASRPALYLSTLGLALSCDGPGPEVCYDVCGAGTVCVDKRCVPAPPAADADEQENASAPRKGRKRGKKRRRNDSSRVDEAEGQGAQRPPFQPVSDRHVPRYDPNETQHIGPDSGSERLPDHTIRQHLSGLESKFNTCIATAAEYSPTDLPAGRIDFEFGIRPTGRISGVNVKAPKHLQVFGIVPCLRKALHDHAFPAYDGPTTGVTYSFRVE